MPDTTTLVSLFHSEEHATKALRDLQAEGVPQQSIQVLGGTARTAAPEQSLASLQGLNLPDEDLQVLADGLKSGGTIIVVRADDAYTRRAEDVFERHNADQVDERAVAGTPIAQASAGAAAAAGTAIPVIEETLVVGKRKVEVGGVRVFRRLVEIPVEEQVVLHEERANVERRPVNRPISEADVAKLQDQTLEVQTMGEEVVVGKTARVVEEISIGKDVTERTQTVKDTVRKTQVEVEQLTADVSRTAPVKK